MKIKLSDLFLVGVDAQQRLIMTGKVPSNLLQSAQLFPIKNYEKLYYIGFLSGEYYVYNINRNEFVKTYKNKNSPDKYVGIYKNGTKRQYKVSELYLQSIPSRGFRITQL